MLKLLSRLFREKPPTINYADEKGIARMSKMRRKTMEMAQLAKADEQGDATEPSEGRKDLLSKARDMEIETNYKGYGGREEARKSKTLTRDWQKRVSHLEGFEVDPQF